MNIEQGMLNVEAEIQSTFNIGLGIISAKAYFYWF